MTQRSPDGHIRHRTPRRLSGDDGVAMVEVALIAPLFFTLIFGLLEYGVFFRNVLTVKDAVGDAARYGAILGPGVASDASVTDANGDYWIARRVRENLASLEISRVERLVIFKGTSAAGGNPLDQITPTCRNTDADGVNGVCNVYPPNDTFLAVYENDLTAFDESSGPSSMWEPSSRNDGTDCRCSSQIEYLGVYVRLRGSGLTGLFGDALVVEEAQVLRLEPSLAVVA